MSRRARGKDAEFRDELVRLLPRLRRFALSLTGDLDKADDLVQAACVRALSRRHQWRDGSRLDSWMFKIIHRLMIDTSRAMRVRAPHFRLEEERFVAKTGNIMRKVEAKWSLGKVAAAMRKMTVDERLILSLVCIDGMSYRHAAETLQIPVGTVMSRLARARKKLHRLVAASH